MNEHLNHKHLNIKGTIGLEDFHLDIDFSIKKFQTLVISGKNGVGKTTLLKTLAGILPLIAGEISVDNVVWDKPTDRYFLPPQNRNIGMVFAEPRLFDFLDLTANVAFGLRRAGVPKHRATDLAQTQLIDFGLENYLNKKPRVLSRGQAQKANLARALVKKPEILLLDEPLVSLDENTSHEIATLLKETRATKVYVTHSKEEAEILGGMELNLSATG